MFEKMEYDIMLAISEELPEHKDLIMGQYLQSIKTREFTGHGFYTNFDNVGDSVLFDGSFKKDLGMLSAILNDECTVGFVLFIRDGRISQLEGYTFGDDWPSMINAYVIKMNEMDEI